MSNSLLVAFSRSVDRLRGFSGWGLGSGGQEQRRIEDADAFSSFLLC